MNRNIRRRENAVAAALVGFLLLAPSELLHAQVTSTAGTGNLNTQVSKVGDIYQITQGTRNGQNLFHSFAEFSVGATETARFQTTNLTPDGTVGNLLGRVTGGTPSSLLGTIDSITYYPNANLFLMNPAGIIFGSGSTLNVGGSAHFSTADYIKLNDGVQFDAIGPIDSAALSSAPVAAFGFMGPTAAPITVQGDPLSSLSVPTGKTLSLVGGDVTMTGGTLSAPSGKVNLASAASAGEVELTPNLELSLGTLGGAVSLSGGAAVTVSGSGAGTVAIRGGTLVIADASLSADTGNGNGAPIGIDLKLTGNLELSDTRGMPVITARTTGTGDAGKVDIESANLNATSDVPTLFALIDTHTSGTGRAGEVSIKTGTLHVQGPNTTQFTFVDSGTEGAGNGNNVTINAASVNLNSSSISTGDFVARNRFFAPTGSAGNLMLEADNIQGDFFILSTESFGGFDPAQQGGDITIRGRNTPATINFLNGQVVAGGVDRGGNIILNNIDILNADFTFFETFTVLGAGGGVTANGRVIELTNGSSFNSSTFGDGHAGAISVIGADRVSLLGITGPNPLGIHRPSGVFSNSFGDLGPFGDSGSVSVITPVLTMNEGRINTSTASSGLGGNVTVIADTVTITGEFPNPQFQGNPAFSVTAIPPSGIFTETVGSDLCSGTCGRAGNVLLDVGSLSMSAGSQLDSGTSSTGNGGNITVNARSSISLSGTLSNGEPVGIFSRTSGTDPGSGAGGTITMGANQVQLSNGASVSASSSGTGNSGTVSVTTGTFISDRGSVTTSATQALGGNIGITSVNSTQLSNNALVSASSSGAGNAGNITINAGKQFVMNDSSVTTQASQASGGNITINASDLVLLRNSQINTSVAGGAGTIGGNITIDPNFVILQNSKILAQAFAGQGGNITIIAGSFFADPSSTVSASSQLGISGQVNIQSPVSFLSGTFSQLPRNPVQAASLLQAHCAARVGGEHSSFVQRGRDGLPPEPGGWLASPMLAAAAPSEVKIGQVSSPEPYDLASVHTEASDGPLQLADSRVGPLVGMQATVGSSDCGS